jgi:regulatory protein
MTTKPGHRNQSKPEPDLPAQISTIEPQKKRTDRYSLFCGSDFIIGVSGQTLLRFNLKKGVEITPFLFNQLQEAEEYQAIKDYFLRLLGRRDHARGELHKKGRIKGFPATIMDEVLDELSDKNYLNEEVFAAKFITDKLAFSKWGPQKIKSELIKKGVHIQLIEKLLKEHTGDLELSRICVDLVVKRKARYLRENDPLKRRQKIIGWLRQKGFEHVTIQNSLTDIEKELNV